MDIYEIITAVLVLLGSAVVELFRKKRGVSARPVEEVTAPDEDMEVIHVEVKEPETTPVMVQESVRKTVPSVRKAPAAVEELTETEKEEIDPKKLVIYSEIMKTKF